MLKPENVTAVIDSREQCPLDLSPLQTTTSGLPTGDYSVVGLESVIAIERKSTDDLVSCVGRDRERFDREVQRLLAYPVRALIVESTWDAMEQGFYRSKVRPSSVVGSLLGWAARGLPVMMAGDHDRAGRMVARMLFIAARRRWNENRHMVRQ